ncbi:unnamed protein product [Calypogeia fissa]
MEWFLHLVSITGFSSYFSEISPNPSQFHSSGSCSENGGHEESETGKLNSEEKNGSGKMGPDDFELLACVGIGGFAKVFQCRKKGTDDIFAMKVITKNEVLQKTHVKAERDILTKVAHPFIVTLHYAFQTRTKLYLLFDFINGGHLFFQLERQKMFSEEVARVYAAEIVCAVAHLHTIGIIHRDLKPENILLDAEGHVKLTDFGLAKEVGDATKSNSFCGTPNYMAPEIILATGHGRPADWWSLGIVLFEMLTGKPPYAQENPHQLHQNIFNKKLKIPTYLTSEAVSLLKGLLQTDPSKRLGSGPQGADEIKQHKWFKNITWRKVEARELQPRFQPTVNGARCVANFNDFWTNKPLGDSLASTIEVEETMFVPGFSYIAPEPYLAPGPDN